ncbi:hypothetical protein [Streptomyces cellostaticus]
MAVARTFCRDAAMWVLDEPTSSSTAAAYGKKATSRR